MSNYKWHYRKEYKCHEDLIIDRDKYIRVGHREHQEGL